MTQSVNIGVALGAAKTGESIGYRLLNLDGTTYAAFTTTNVAETTVAGTYVVTTAVTAPDAGARIVWGPSGTDYVASIIDPVPVSDLIDGAITADTIATDAIDADALASDAIAEINATVDTALSDYDAPTKAELDAGFAALNDPTAAAVADAVWDESTSGHTTSGTFGEQLKTDVDAILDDTGTSGVAVANGAITAATIATDAIDADALAADAIAEINATVDTAITDAALATAAALATVDSNVDAILADTGTDGVVVASIAANAMNASALATDAVTEIQSGLATASAVSTVDTVVDGIKAVTDNLPDSGALTTIASNIAAILADTGTDGVIVASIATDAVNAAALAADAVAEINATVDTAISDAGLATAAKLLAYVQLLARKDSAIATDNATELTAINADGGSGAGSFANTTDSSEALRDRGDAGWTTATGFSTHSAADVRTEMDSNSTQLAAIVADTNEIQGDLANGGRVDLLIDAIKAVTDLLPDGGALTTLLNNVSAALADTNELQTDWADGGRLDAILDARASQASVNALNDIDSTAVQTAAAAALTAYDPPTKAELDSAVSPLATASALATVDGNVDAILDDTGTSGVVVASIATDAVNAAALANDAIAEINATVDTAISDASLATAASISALNNLSAADVNAEVDTALADYDAPTKAELDAGFAALNDPTAAAVVSALMAHVLESGKTVDQAWLDIWATVAGDASANDGDSPTSITYDSPDGTVQVTHTLGETTRTKI